MKQKVLTTLTLMVILAVLGSACQAAPAKMDVPAIKAATSQYHDTAAAEAAGYVLVPDLDHCFENPGVGAMGFHYINPAMLDTSLDALKPEAMVYAPQADGQLELGAVEYIVPAAAWEEAGNTEPPQLRDQHLHLNETLGVYVLHAWIWNNNPAGLYEDWNPDVTCPPAPVAQSEVEQIKEATALFSDTDAALAAGYGLVPDLDHCFENPGVGAMGFHYINTDLLDTDLDVLQPEAMVYAPRTDGTLEFGAVEYIVPASAWEEAGNTEPPQLLGQHLHLNEALGVFVLHAWIWKDNPSGLYEDWNPEVSCPAGS